MLIAVRGTRGFAVKVTMGGVVRGKKGEERREVTKKRDEETGRCEEGVGGEEEDGGSWPDD